MNKKAQGLELVFLTCVVLLFISFIVFGAMKTDQYIHNKTAKESCRLLEKQGHETKIETAYLYGMGWKVCYVHTDGGFVPYDRFWSNK